MSAQASTTTDNTGVTTTQEGNLTELNTEGAVVEPVVQSSEAGPVDPIPEPKPVEKKDKSSSRFAALARKDKEIRQRAADAEKAAREIKAREEALAAREARWTTAKKRPMEALKELGFTYADITQDVLGAYEAPPVDPVDEKLNPVKEQFTKEQRERERLQSELDQLKQELTNERRQKAYEAGIKAIRETVANADRYELISTMGEEGVELVRDTVVEYWDRYQQELSLEEAADMVEKYYEEQYVDKIASTKKLQSRVAPKAPVSTPPVTKEVTAPKPTLSNSLSTAPKQTPDVDSMSKADAIAYLAKKLTYRE